MSFPHISQHGLILAHVNNALYFVKNYVDNTYVLYKLFVSVWTGCRKLKCDSEKLLILWNEYVINRLCVDFHRWK
jgi:hypothetical protein